MEGSDNFIDPENEVKKLQALVKKLEKQNELLRVKQKPNLDGTHPHEGITGISSTHTASSSQAHPSSNALKNKASEVGLEAVDVLDVDRLSLKDEEDSWLYSSPKALTPQQSNINLYEWVRQDFDHPSPELESARRSLLSKLDEVARMNRSSSTPALASAMSPAKCLSPLSRSTEDSRQYYTEDSPKRSSIPHHRYSMLQPKGSHIENGTCTRRKKPEEQPRFVMGGKERNEEVPYHLHESTDVEKLARQQEESLRQSMATYTSPKRVLHNKSMSFASDTDNSGSPLGSSRSSPIHYEYENSLVSRHRNSLGSDCSTPPDSPSVIQQHSTPNLDQAFAGRNATVSRLQYPHSALHSSNSSLEHQSVGSTDDLTYESRITSHLPSPGLRSASPAAGGLRTGLASSHGLLAQRSALPTPRRGIPRPSVPASARSSLPVTRRSGIPSQRPSSAQGRNESWRDGCF